MLNIKKDATFLVEYYSLCWRGGVSAKGPLVERFINVMNQGMSWEANDINEFLSYWLKKQFIESQEIVYGK